LTLSGRARTALAGRPAAAVLQLLAPGDYFAGLAYISPSSPLMGELTRLRHAVRDGKRVATTLAVGPRYLHSTGQLHKGGPGSGVFLLITVATADGVDVAIPGQPYSFATLERAQALGDFASLDAAGRRAIHAHLPSADPHTLAELVEALLGGMSS
jgi:hypothetical protein